MSGKKLKLSDDMFKEKMHNAILEKLENSSWDYSISKRVILEQKYKKRNFLIKSLVFSSMVILLVITISFTLHKRNIPNQNHKNNSLTTAKPFKNYSDSKPLPAVNSNKQTNSKVALKTSVEFDSSYEEGQITANNESLVKKEFDEINRDFGIGDFGIDELIDSSLNQKFIN